MIVILPSLTRSLQDGQDRIPEPPSPDVPQGVLPRLIATLVNRRRQVKALMKDKSISHSKLLQVSNSEVSWRCARPKSPNPVQY
jgi:DNA polymerase elongation subunit (family B)